jgi:hypothetical protein
MNIIIGRFAIFTMIVIVIIFFISENIKDKFQKNIDVAQEKHLQTEVFSSSYDFLNINVVPTLNNSKLGINLKDKLKNAFLDDKITIGELQEITVLFAEFEEKKDFFLKKRNAKEKIKNL